MTLGGLFMAVALVAPAAVARVSTGEPVVALTFDACATGKQPNRFDRAVFDILKRERIPATIFVSGRWIEFHAAEARELAAEPWVELGNHSYSHTRGLAAQGATRITQDIAHTEALIAGLGRHSVAFRPPGGLMNQRVLHAAASNGLPTVVWDVVSGDAGGHLRARRIVDSVSRDVRPGSIVVFHINGRGPRTKEALPAIIAALRARGFRFVSVSELLGLPDARREPPPRTLAGTRIASPVLDGHSPIGHAHPGR